MDWEEIEQTVLSMIEDVNLLLKRKESDRAFLMLLKDVYSKYARICQVAFSWNQRTLNECLLSGQDAFEKVMDTVERHGTVSEIQDQLYAFGQTLLTLQRCLSMEQKYYIIIYGINQKTPDYL